MEGTCKGSTADAAKFRETSKHKTQRGEPPAEHKHIEPDQKRKHKNSRDTTKEEVANPGEVDAVAASEKSDVRRLRNIRVGQERLIDIDVVPPSS